MTSWALLGLGDVALDMVDAMEARGDRLAQVILNRPARPELLAALPAGTPVVPVEEFQGPVAEAHLFGFVDLAKRPFLEAVARHALAFETLAHPSAVVSPRAQWGRGCFVSALSVVGPAACLGEFVNLGRCTSVGHNSVVGDFTHIAAGATVAGGTTVGARVRIGAGATLIDHIRVADDTVVGAGAVVVRDITEPGTYVGVPARRMERGAGGQ